ncbi:MAG: LPXTG cell wall anchor domain-containing protein [Roseiflexaceae bacterium]
MPDRTPFLDWRRNILTAVGLSLILLALLYLLAGRGAPTAQAQGTLRIEITKTLQGGNVVTVGQYLTFTIRITNTGTISIAQLPLLDQYDATIIRLESTDPSPTSSSSGSIAWSDLTTNTLFGPLPPGQSITVIAVFRAIAPKPATVNAAKTGTLVGVNGQSGAGGGDQDGGETVGGKVIVQKSLAPGQTPMSGQPITFTISVRNDGAADVVQLPLVDNYDTAYLQFRRASPRPTFVDGAAGELRWDDLLPALGLSRLHPNQVVTVTTVFTALKSIDAAVINHAGSGEIRDEFGNRVEAPRQAEIPIRILPGPGEAAPTPRSRPREDRPQEQETPTPTPAAETPTLTPVVAITATAEISTTAITPTEVTPTPAGSPITLPRTGGPAAPVGWLLFGLVLLLAGALALLHRRRSAR